MLATALGSCDSGSDDLAIKNGTDRVLVVSEVYEGRHLDEQKLEPGQTARFDSLMGGGGPYQVRDEAGGPMMSIVSLTRSHPRFVITDVELEPNVVNDTDLELVLFEDLRGSQEPFELANLAPGEGHAAATPSECFSPLGASTPDGRVIAQMERALCPGDSWVIESQS